MQCRVSSAPVRTAQSRGSGSADIAWLQLNNLGQIRPSNMPVRKQSAREQQYSLCRVSVQTRLRTTVVRVQCPAVAVYRG